MKIRRILLSCLSLVMAVVAFARSANPASVLKAKDKSETAKDKSETASLLSVAGKLVKYGYQTRSSLPLIQALEIYNRLGVTHRPKEKTSDSDAVAEPSSGKPSNVSYDPARILADAILYADGDKNILALVKAAGKARGRIPGPVSHLDVVKANSSDVYTWTFAPDEPAIIVVSGDGDSDLDLFVYDSNSVLLASDTDDGDDCAVIFTPGSANSVYVKVTNNGSVNNSYAITTN